MYRDTSAWRPPIQATASRRASVCGECWKLLCETAVACDGCPPLSQLFEQYADGGGGLLVCPICFNARKLDQNALVSNAKLAGATPMLEWIGDDHAAIFSY
jgi:DsrE/DsrF-like family